jgi:tRNA threonylcarbamoyladenosine modification (KEOPS) complex Cgi121 subunit
VLPGAGKILVAVVCGRFTEHVEAVSSSLASKKVLVAAFKLDEVRHFGLEAVLTAVVSSYAAIVGGRSIARKAWIEPHLYLYRTRNIRDVIPKLPKPGDTVLVAVAAPSDEGEPILKDVARAVEAPDEECIVDRASSPALVSSIAQFPVEARVYRARA